MHCHILNLRDADGPAFVVRHVTDGDEGSTLLDGASGVATWLASLPNYLVTSSAEKELAWLKKITLEVQGQIQNFCEEADRNQAGIFFAAEGRQAFGFTSNRTRNAARLLSLYPEVDIFTPSMVDFYEGKRDYSDPRVLVNYYSQLNIATLGRFLPLVSFNPTRAFEEGGRASRNKYLNLIRESIEEKGFVGVKIHPSTGFAPIHNREYGCPNSIRQHLVHIPDAEADFYDEILNDLFVYCRGADIPILTHSGPGVAANGKCMNNPDTDLSTRSNSPALWAKAIKRADLNDRDIWGNAVPTSAKLTVCFAHLAGGFEHKKGSLSPHPWLLSLDDIMRNNSRVYVDLSDQSEMFESRTGAIKKEYASLFTSFLADNPYVANRLMYGSDWHMPGAAMVGSKYFPGMKELIPYNLRDRTLGLNAAEFFGLAKGRRTRGRLEQFYRRNGVSIAQVSWVTKVDRAMDDRAAS